MELSPGIPFLLPVLGPDGGGSAFGVVVAVVGGTALVHLQAGHTGTMPAEVVETGMKFLAGYAEEVGTA